MNYEIEITRRCNMACPGCNRLCDIVKQPSDTDMDMSDIATVVSEINGCDTRPKRIAILGGEPTLNKDCVEICRYVRDHVARGDRVLIGSNYTNKDVLREAGRYAEVRKDTKKDVPKEVFAVKLGYHSNILLSPKELGDPIRNPGSCYVFHQCGISVHKYEGQLLWCWCGPGTSVCRLLMQERFMYPSLAKLLASDIGEFRREICPHCAHLSPVMHKAVDTAGQVSSCFVAGLERIRGSVSAATSASKE